MARLIRQERPAAATADQLEILMARDFLEIGGCEVVVAEYSLFESLTHRADFAPLVAGFRAGLSGTEGSLEAVLDVLAEHRDRVVKLVAVSCKQPEEWVRDLSSADGEALLFSWWSVNSNFFIREVVRPALQKAARTAQAGLTSSPPSSPAGTMPSDSSTTQPAS